MKKSFDWQPVYDSYPVNKELIWLNNCGTTPAGDFIEKELNKFITEYAKRGIFAAGYSYIKVKEDIQNIVSRLLNCRPENVAIIHNTSEGMNLISWGLNLKAGDEILLLENEYPSNVYPWQHWSEKGVVIKFVPLANCPEAFLDNIKKSINSKTRLISMSSVHWCTGMPLPLRDISDICNSRNIEFVVDAAQGAGHVEIDVNGWGIDYISFSAWKWLLGPLGLGVIVVTDEGLSRLNHVFKGTESVIGDNIYLPYKDELKNSAERYMYSTASFIDWIYFKSSLEYLENIGFEKVMNRIYDLADCMKDILKNLGFNLNTDYFKETKTGILVAGKSGINISTLVKKLMGQNIVTCERLGKLRVAPHIYNSYEQLERTGEVIKSLLVKS